MTILGKIFRGVASVIPGVGGTLVKGMDAITSTYKAVENKKTASGSAASAAAFTGSTASASSGNPAQDVVFGQGKSTGPAQTIAGISTKVLGIVAGIVVFIVMVLVLIFKRRKR